MKRFAALLSVLAVSSCAGTLMDGETPFDDSDVPVVVNNEIHEKETFNETIYANGETYRYEEERTIVSDDQLADIVTPDVYGILATRATNKMLDETSYIYAQKPAPKLYIKSIEASDVLPAGFFVARRQVREIIEGSRTFTLVENINDADYTLAIEVDKVEVNAPAVKCMMTLYDGDDEPVKEWVETIQRIGNDDKSWW